MIFEFAIYPTYLKGVVLNLLVNEGESHLGRENQYVQSKFTWYRVYGLHASEELFYRRKLGHAKIYVLTRFTCMPGQHKWLLSAHA